ncbi:MAG: hypothetical protein LBJ46_09760 [Planctomycetota bacterium]|jgi:hypothetical protein|nr:hypothetical protein [Planctomycetota bacterium]
MRSLLLAASVVVFGTCALAAEPNPLPNKFLTAQPGEWIIVGDIENPGETTRLSIIARGVEGGEDYVLLRREKFDADGNVVEKKDHRVKMKRYQERLDRINERAYRITREKIGFQDEEITVYTAEWESERIDGELKIWISPDIPVSGFFRLWSSDPDFPTYELIEYGRD